MNKIIITGPESSGKTTLSNDLKKYFNTNLVTEYAREYIDKLNSKYNYEDLLKIAKQQLKNENKTQLTTPLICDTDLITIKIWSEYKYSKCDTWILQHIKKQKNESRFYLLCKPDLEWKYDPQRENQFDRKAVFDIYIDELEALNHQYFVINSHDRLNKAIKALKKII
ncbi:MAG: ATP-binding protein [Flavobacteriales bacterium]|jgi:nicotinamide riboside kinase|nr:ATP-binding protein [Flavobacteriales bacterium]